ncbi:MAG: S1 RNA-binding domain-containing protein [Clostridia bacterium]|nr:S1 RNA-binding domain-containing protein [Clostridia bacterium]MBQ8369076.1 S1 RNA-binding domain-containing protein [Clostridia bacterium]
MQGTKSYVPEGALYRTAENRRYLRSADSLACAMADGAILEAMAVLCDCASMELTVELCGGVRGVIPRSECCIGDAVKDIAVITRVGRPVQFRVVSMEESSRGTVARLSRRLAQQECMDNYIRTLIPGDIIPARVTHLEPFGAFCDIGCGIVSLLTVDRVSVSRISHPADRFRAGDCIDAVVASVEESGRIYLSHRELLGTWSENAAAFTAGQTVTGIVRSVEDYGVFVELAPNLAGLAEPTPGVSPGDMCSVYIKSILPERMKVKLVLIDAWREDAVRQEMRYFVDTASVRHMDHWRYSPDGARKLVETEFAPVRETAAARG